MAKYKKNIPGSGNSIQDLIDSKRANDNPDASRSRAQAPARPDKRSHPAPAPGASRTTLPPEIPEDEAFLRTFERSVTKPGAAAHPKSLAELRRLTPEDLKKRNRGAVSTPRPAQGAPGAAQPGSAQTSPRSGNGKMPAQGDILHLEGAEDHVVLFDRDVPSRGYQLVHLLDNDGTLHAQGISLLDAYEFRRLGALPPDDFAKLRQSMRWNRDLLVFHLDRFQDSRLIPHPGDGKSAASSDNRHESAPLSPTRSAQWPRPETLPNRQDEPAEQQPEPALAIDGIQLQCGQRFTVAFGPGRQWEAVYWGRDSQGTVVAHNTGGDWALMHMDLERFADSLKPGRHMDASERQEVVRAIQNARNQ